VRTAASLPGHDLAQRGQPRHAEVDDDDGARPRRQSRKEEQESNETEKMAGFSLTILLLASRLPSKPSLLLRLADAQAGQGFRSAASRSAPAPAPAGSGFFSAAGLSAPAPLRPKSPSEFELNRGRVIDTLRHDYPLLFTQPPDLDLFVPSVTLSDPSGAVRVRGVTQYARLFGMLRFMRRAAMQDAQLTYRLVIDEGGSAVRPPSTPRHPLSLHSARK